MADSDFAHIFRSLKELNLDTVDEQDYSQLGETFDICTSLMNVIDYTDIPSNELVLQESVQALIRTLKHCTQIVNELGLFSSNETAEELQTSSMKYLLLPAMLGSLHLQIKTEDASQRLNNIEIADIYFKDFLLRCTNYELCGRGGDHLKDIFDNEEDTVRTPTLDANQLREKKIQLYKRKKELAQREKTLKPALKRPESEEYIREYYLVRIEKWIITAEEELENSKREREILKFMSKKKDGQSGNITKEKKSATKPLQPFIITKNEVQKQVFGLGYPSIPVLTIDDFYRQRFEKQIEEQKLNKLEQQRQQKKGKSLQDAALSGEGLSKEEEDLEKERLMDMDDPLALAKARSWDDWKDENPRGAGNRYNKG